MATDYQETVGTWLLRLMDRKRIRSAARLSLETDIPVGQLQEYLLDRRIPDIDDCMRLARCFQVSSEVMIARCNDMRRHRYPGADQGSVSDAHSL